VFQALSSDSDARRCGPLHFSGHVSWIFSGLNVAPLAGEEDLRPKLMEAIKALV
jgi:hypothetical protein